MEISREDIEHLADLARVKLKDEEVDKFQNDAKEIVGFFDKLAEVDLPDKEVEQTMNVSETVADNKREDRGTDKEVRQFSAEERGFLKIPKVFE